MNPCSVDLLLVLPHLGGSICKYMTHAVVMPSFFFFWSLEWGVRRAQVVHDHGFNLVMYSPQLSAPKKGHDKMNGSMHCYIGITISPSNLKKRLNSGAPLYK
jgi:hypothetical protein